MENAPATTEKQVTVKMPAAGVAPVEKIKFENFSLEGWDFNHSIQGMSSEKEMDQFSDKVGIAGLPEVFYGSNHLYVSNKEFNILLDFNATDSLSYSGYAKRSQFLHKDGKNEFKQVEGDSIAELTEDMKKMTVTISGLKDNEKDLNQIDIIPAAVKVEQSKHWEGKDTSKIKDFKQVTQTSDWTYSTPYKGTTRYLSGAAKSIKEATDLDLAFEENKENSESLRVERVAEATIPFDKLGPENPIVHFAEIHLFECDLEDCGYAMSKVRYRVMGDCFYILLRYYLRTDGVNVRIFDTRIFHEFGTDFIHREFQHRESTFDELRKINFDLSSEWLLSDHQSDMVFQVLGQKQLIQEQILLK